MAQTQTNQDSLSQSPNLDLSPNPGRSSTEPTPLASDAILANPYEDRAAILTLFKKLKKEAFDNRTQMERAWERFILYVVGRQWIYYHPKRGQWIDRRMAKWIPRPVTNKIRETLQTIRAVLSAIDLGGIVRPNGQDPQNVTAAAVADEVEPILKDEHRIKEVFHEGDFWFLTTGNAFLHPWWDSEVSETGKGKTDVCSGYEIGLPPNSTNFADVPYLIRKRWRDKAYYTDRDSTFAEKLRFGKTTSDQSLQVLRTVTSQVDLGLTGTGYNSVTGSMQQTESEGITEYELWLKATTDYPGGLFVRAVGEGDDLQIVEGEAFPDSTPGEFPLKDVKGRPVFPWCHAGYESIGGRIWAQGAFEPLIPLQDAINRLDSMIELIYTRTANPVWLEPKGAEVERFTGEPGIVVKYNLLNDGQGKPERIPGENIPPTLFQYREMRMKDFEELAGTFDVLKGTKPPGVEAFSALQLLVERSQSRFSSAFAARGQMYRDWLKIALELERAFGRDERTKTVLGPNRKWSFQKFLNADLQGDVSVIVEDGTNVPKTSLGKRAAVQQATSMKLIDPTNPEQQMAILTDLGLTHLIPSLSAHTQTALSLYEKFEEWVAGGMVPPVPLQYRPWYEPRIHLNEFDKWINSDRMRDLLAADQMNKLAPMLEEYRKTLQLMVAVMMQTGGLNQVLPTPQAPPPGSSPGAPGGGGAGQAMQNSNEESGSTTNVPSGQGEGAQNQGPA